MESFRWGESFTHLFIHKLLCAFWGCNEAESSAADAVDTNSRTILSFKRFVSSSGELIGSKHITLHPWKAINWSSSINLVHAFSSIRLSSRWDGNAKFIEQWMERSLYSGALSLAVHQHGRMSESTMKKTCGTSLVNLAQLIRFVSVWMAKKKPSSTATSKGAGEKVNIIFLVSIFCLSVEVSSGKRI